MPRRALLSLFLLPGMCMAQGYTPPPPPLTVDPCTTTPNPVIPVAPDPKAKPPVCPPPAPAAIQPAAPVSGPPSAAEQFPFPGDPAPAAPQPGKPSTGSAAKPSAADQFPYPGSQPPATAPAKTPAADQFPYPGETSRSPDAVPEGDTPRYVPDSPAPGNSPPPSNSNATDDSSSSSSSSSSGALPTAADDGSDPSDSADAGGAKKGRRALPKVAAVSPAERVTEDLRVAKFYSGVGNYQGAYLRGKDAIKIMPNDAESHFVLAQAAQKLNRKDEAIAEYDQYLKLDPGGDWSKAAEKALGELQ